MCEHAKKLNTIKAWVDYLLEFPKGECAEEAKMAIENADGKNDEPESEEQKAANEEKRKEEEKAARIEEARRKMEEQILKAEEEKVAAELRAKQEAEARKEAELKAKQEAAARREAELKAQREAEAARREAELKAKQEAEAARREAELKAKQEAEARRPAEIQAMKERKAKTGGSLYWSGRSEQKMNYNSARQYCGNLAEGGYTDWRLPTIVELRTTIQNCASSQTGGSCKVSYSCLSSMDCGGKHCPDCGSRRNNGGYYSKLGDDDTVSLWSSSMNPQYRRGYIWCVNFENGAVSGFCDQPENYYVRCVR